MDSESTKYECPVCGHSVTVFVEVSEARCWHYGTSHDVRGRAAGPATMRRAGRGLALAPRKRKGGK